MAGIGVAPALAAEAASAQEVTARPARQWTIYLLPHSHVDIGYTKLQTLVEADQKRFLEEAIDAARRTAGYPEGAQFKWNVEVLWAVDSYLREASPGKRQDFIEAVRKGWIGLDALYVNELTGLCRPEELLRLTDHARQLKRRWGLPIDSAMTSDIPGFTWGIVPALAQVGVKYFSACPNLNHRLGSVHEAWDERPFYWVSPSGREKLLYWQTGGGYGAKFSSEEQLLSLLDRFERAHPRYPYDVLSFRHCRGDNAGPDPTISEFVKQWNGRHANPKLIIATTSQVFREFERRYGHVIPSMRGDLTPYWEDGAGSAALETALNRASAERLVQAETLWAMFRSADYPAVDFRAAWRNVLLYDEHTFGAQSYVRGGRYPPGSEGYAAQWKIHRAFAMDADVQSRSLIDRALVTDRCAAGKPAAVHVLNTSSWARTDLVIVPPNLAVAGDVVRSADGKDVPSQRLTSGELAFLARDVPALAAKRFTFHAGQVRPSAAIRAGDNALSNRLLALTVDRATGAITHLRSEKLSVDLVDRRSGQALNDYFYVPGKNPKDARRNGPVKITVTERGPLVAALRMESDAPGCNKLSRELRIVDGLDRLDIINVVDKAKIPLPELLQTEPRKEGFYFGFAFHVPGGVMRMETPWAVVRPEVDQLPGACKNWFAVQRWVDISNRDYGVTWSPVDAPLVEVGAIAPQPATPQSAQEWRRTLSPSSTLYSFVMNNYWTTGFPHDQHGPVTFRYSISPHGPFDAAHAARFGIATSQPLLVLPDSDCRTCEQPLLDIQPDDVIVTALKPAEDGTTWILRLFGVGGRTSKATLRWRHTAPQAVWLSSLAEERGAKIAGPVEVPGFGIVTLRIDWRQ